MKRNSECSVKIILMSFGLLEGSGREDWRVKTTRALGHSNGQKAQNRGGRCECECGCGDGEGDCTLQER